LRRHIHEKLHIPHRVAEGLTRGKRRHPRRPPPARPLFVILDVDEVGTPPHFVILGPEHERSEVRRTRGSMPID
jgi:hypothetical protein